MAFTKTQNTDYPLVSAIMLAGQSPIEDIQLSIECFKSQTYPYKELIIVNNANTHFEASELNIKAERNIFLIDTPSKYFAGMARNYGISTSNGKILAQFDPDYWYAPNRLEVQIANMAENEAHAIILTSTLSYSFISGLSGYNTNNANSILNTMVFLRPTNIDYDNVNKQEEYSLLNKMAQNNLKIISINMPEIACKLYTTKHGKIYTPINNGNTKEHYTIVKKAIKHAQNIIDI